LPDHPYLYLYLQPSSPPEQNYFEQELHSIV
jgi:hypothetical protein